jgi:hypothetical protein
MALLYMSFKAAPPLVLQHRVGSCKSCSASAPPSRSVSSICHHLLGNSSFVVWSTEMTALHDAASRNPAYRPQHNRSRNHCSRLIIISATPIAASSLDHREDGGGADEQRVRNLRGDITRSRSIRGPESRQACRMMGMPALPLLVSSRLHCWALVRRRIRSTGPALLLTLGFGGSHKPPPVQYCGFMHAGW